MQREIEPKTKREGDDRYKDGGWQSGKQRQGQGQTERDNGRYKDRKGKMIETCRVSDDKCRDREM